ncbi:hypothetical protein [Streptomyces sp. NBC_00239]|uniref:hypothetical protein n=1 Tax=Streptomyces sp. NBC_00239 TaxID=2903640 RepID=UPI002E2B3293|nr:hypothetical protein [Streptomyces sp. NBC_00239]
MLALPLAGGAPRTVLAGSHLGLFPAPGGRPLAVGGTSATAWGVQRFTAPSATTPPSAAMLLPVPPSAEEFVKTGLSLGRGALRVVEYEPGNDSALHTQTWQISSRPGAGLAASARTAGRDDLAAERYLGENEDGDTRHPVAVAAGRAGRALADHLSVPFHFASPDTPDDEAPRWQR